MLCSPHHPLAPHTPADADTCPTGHASSSARNGAGENLYWAGGSSLPDAAQSYADAVASWYGELTTGAYDFAAGGSGNGGVVGHFTQLVWKGSSEIGCGVSVACSNMFGGMPNSAVVCRYSSAGNYIGQYTANVGALVASGACGAAPCPGTCGTARCCATMKGGAGRTTSACLAT